MLLDISQLYNRLWRTSDRTGTFSSRANTTWCFARCARMDTSFHHAPWGTGCGKAQFSLCEISAYAPLRHRKSSFLRGVVLAAKAKAAGRHCGAKTAVETKRAALMQQVLEMQVSVETRPERWVRRAAIVLRMALGWRRDGGRCTRRVSRTHHRKLHPA